MQTIKLNDYADYLKPRDKDWHKGMSGHVLIIGGEYGYSGAPRLAAEAALRVGAGLVSVATQPENALVMNAFRPEIMCHAIRSPEDIKPLAEKATVIILGPGLGQTEWSKTIWDNVMQLQLPMVVDADGLNLLAQKNKQSDNWVLTPHPAEAGRLLKRSAQLIQENRESSTREIQHQYGGVCVLKGAGSLVFSSESNMKICEQGNPGMATAGMGDVLSGVIGGLIAQKIPLSEAASMAVIIHAMAGDLAAKQGERGMIASDLMPYLRQLVNVS